MYAAAYKIAQQLVSIFPIILYDAARVCCYV